MLTFDIDRILFGILKANPALNTEISGGIYVNQRPDKSISEDVVINTITLSQDIKPQIGTSNINIHVSDINVSINGAQQKKPDNIRLNKLAKIVLSAISEAKHPGLICYTEFQTVIAEPEINQHYVNIRISWNIH